MSPRVVTVDPVLGPLTDDLLTREVRVWQRAGGHRFSSDDVATAYFAWRACATPPARALDLGSGLGSVLLLLAWNLRGTIFSAVEAQDPSFALLERNVARSGFGERIWIHHGDFRGASTELAARGPFDLVTGTPPYWPIERCVAAEDAQRGFARVERRGGVEAYVATGASVLAPEGVLVICGDSRSDGRVRAAAADHRLALVETHEVVPKAGKPALFTVWAMRRDASCGGEPRRPDARTTFTLRTASGGTTPDADALRVFSGFPARLAPSGT